MISSMSGRPAGWRSTARLRPPTTGRCTAPPKCAPSVTISTAITAGIIRRRRFSLPLRWRRCHFWSRQSLWLLTTLAAYIAAIAGILGLRTGVLFALGFPAAIWNITAGQNGFLTAALIGGTLGLLERHPALAGICLGLLTYKPQFGLLFPIVLIADRRWLTIVACYAHGDLGSRRCRGSPSAAQAGRPSCTGRRFRATL